jgi:hypothetical protein
MSDEYFNATKDSESFSQCIFSLISALALIDMELVMMVASVAHVKEAKYPLLGGNQYALMELMADPDQMMVLVLPILPLHLLLVL